MRIVGPFHQACVNGNHRTDVNYELYYINIARNTVTAGVPLIVLVALNLLVYKHLVRRRAFIAKHRGRNYLSLPRCTPFACHS